MSVSFLIGSTKKRSFPPQLILPIQERRFFSAAELFRVPEVLMVHFRFQQRDENDFAVVGRIEFDRKGDFAQLVEILFGFEIDDAVAQVFADLVGEGCEFRAVLRPGRIDDEQARKLLFGREAAGYSAGGVGAARESAVIARSVRPVARDEKARDGASAACRQLVAVVNAFAFEHVDEELADPERRLGRKIQINVVEAALPDRAKGGEVLFKPGGDSGPDRCPG